MAGKEEQPTKINIIDFHQFVTYMFHDDYELRDSNNKRVRDHIIPLCLQRWDESEDKDFTAYLKEKVLLEADYTQKPTVLELKASGFRLEAYSKEREVEGHIVGYSKDDMLNVTYIFKSRKINGDIIYDESVEPKELLVKPYNRFKPEDGQPYFYIDFCNQIQKTYWNEADRIFDINQWNKGNCYPDEKTAIRVINYYK